MAKTGGAVALVALDPGASARDLAADETHLYWCGGNGIHRLRW